MIETEVDVLRPLLSARTWKLLAVIGLTLLLIGLILLTRFLPAYRLDRQAQSDVRHATVAALEFAHRNGNFDGMDPEALREIDSVLDYRSPTTPTRGERAASVFGKGALFAAAACGKSGTCYWMLVDLSNQNSDPSYASARTDLSRCFAERFRELEFYSSTFEGWED